MLFDAGPLPRFTPRASFDAFENLTLHGFAFLRRVSLNLPGHYNLRNFYV